MHRIVVRIARTELRRTIRNVMANRIRLVVLAALGLVVLGPMLLFGSLFLSTGGERLAAGEVGSDILETVATATTGVVAAGGVGLTVLATARAVTTVADIDQPASLLISTPLRNVVAGLVLKEGLLVLLWVGGPLLVLSSAFAWGATAPLVPVFALATLMVVVAVAVSVGFVLGTSLRHLLTAYEPISQYRTLVLAAVGIAYFLSVAFGWLNQLSALAFDLLGDSPLGWPGQLLLVGTPVVEATPWQAVAGVAGAAGITLVALAAGVRVGEFHWFADPASPPDEAEAVESNDRLGTLLSGLVPRAVRTVTVTAIRRTRRAPARLAYVGYPLFGSVVFVRQAIQTGEIPAFAAVMSGVYVVWAAGALFTLNPLGDHGPALPAVLTSTVSGRAVVMGKVVAGIVCMLPVALVVPPVAGLLSPLDVVETALLTAGTVVGTLVTPVLAAGVGTLFPRFGEVRITNNRQAVMPSKAAFVLYSLAVLLPIGAGAVLAFDSSVGLVATVLSGIVTLVAPVEVTVPESAVTVAAVGILVAGIVAPVLSAGYAIRRFDEYRPG